LDNESSSDRFCSRLRIISAGGPSRIVVDKEPMFAFFWSPNGEKIAYVGIDTEEQRLTWNVAWVHGGGPWRLVSFTPSAELMAMLSFFDQYAHSHSIWSHDSTRLVFAGTLNQRASRGNGAAPNLNKAYVINTEPGSQPRELAGSDLAFWSWN
jgi:hypothetical protein